jgi:hypothetical protein
MEEYFRLGFIRRPEHLVQGRAGQPLEFSWFSHDHHGDEAGRRLDQYAGLAARAGELYRQMPGHRQAAFFQLVLYPVECAALMNEKVICADKSLRDAARGRATAAGHARRARAAAARIIELTDTYNNQLPGVGAKWRHMMAWAPGPWGNQRLQFEMPPLSDFDGIGPPALEVAPEGGAAGTLAGLSTYTRGRRFIDLFNTGKGGISWQARPAHPWLLVEPAAGTFSDGQRLWVTVDWQAAPAAADLESAIEFTSNGGTARVVVPLFNPAAPARDEIRGFVESHGCVSMAAGHFTRRRDRDRAGWQVIGGLGRGGGAVAVFPATLASRTDPADIRAHSPALEFDFHLFTAGEVELHLDCLPTQPVAPGRGVRLAVSIDDGDPQVLGDQARRYPQDVLANLRRCTTRISIARPGPHTLTVWMVDPGVILDKIVLHTAPPVQSCLGPPESFRR